MKKILISLGIVLFSSTFSYSAVNNLVDPAKQDDRFQVDNDLSITVKLNDITSEMFKYLTKKMENPTKQCFEYIFNNLSDEAKTISGIRFNDKDLSRHIEIFTSKRWIICHGDKIFFVDEVLQIKVEE